MFLIVAASFIGAILTIIFTWADGVLTALISAPFGATAFAMFAAVYLAVRRGPDYRNSFENSQTPIKDAS